MSGRVTRFALTATGARRLGLTVRGIRVLIEPCDGDEQAAAEALADQIAALAPADAEVSADIAPIAAPAPPRIDAPRAFVVGNRVWCTVHGAEGAYVVTEVGHGRNAGRVKVEDVVGWCPAHNFRSIDKAPRAGAEVVNDWRRTTP